MSSPFENSSPELIAHINGSWGKRQDTVINIMGLVGADGGRIPLTADVQQWAASRPNATHVANWFGSLDGSKDNTPLVAEIVKFIEDHYDPRGRLVITGKSRGGLNVLQLCRHMSATCGFFQLRKVKGSIPDDQPKGKFFAEPPDATPFTVSVGIDLICVMDATFDVLRVGTQQKVPRMVLQYANWFQDIEDNSGAHANLMRIDPSRTVKVRDENCSKRIPFRAWSKHDFVCQNLGPREANPLVEAELNKPTPQLTVNLPSRGIPRQQLMHNVRFRR